MKLTKKNILLLSFTVFSLFFGAGNLIFPPHLGEQAGSNTAFAFIGFLITAVILPVVGVIVVGKFNGLTNLANKVGTKFSLIFTLLIYISIGPGLGIPRAGSVPFEMAVYPYLKEGANFKLWMAIYTLVFFAVVLWLCLNPGKLVKRIGTFLTPSLLLLIIIMFVTFLIKGDKSVASPQQLYSNNAFMQGFVDGYQTMDTIAALNFGLVVVLTLNSFGINSEKSVIKETIKSSIIAGSILTLVYLMLTIIGTYTSNIYPAYENGALILRRTMFDLLGNAGAIILAAIFTLACLTTCVGLTNSISSFFESKFKRISYKNWVIIITILSFLICNLGLNMLLKVSIPILNAIYPVSIVLILLGLFDKFINKNKYIYKLCIYSTTIISVIYAIDQLANLGIVSNILSYIPLYNAGFGWVIVCSIMLVVSIILNIINNKKVKCY